jgi:hypothetical protein
MATLRVSARISGSQRQAGLTLLVGTVWNFLKILREVVEARAYPELLKDVDQTWDVLPSQMPKVEVVGLCSPGSVLAGTDPIYRHLTGACKSLVHTIFL